MQPESDPKDSRSPNLCTLNELIRKWIVESRLLGHPTPTAKIYESPLSKEIQVYKFLNMFSTLTFDYYSEVSDQVQYIRHFLDKMVGHSSNDPVLCLTFSSSLSDMVSD